MNLEQFPRRRYTHGETPVEFLPNLTKALDGPDIYIKRDDLLGGAAGGNKTRKLEFSMAEAIEQGADTVITCGAIQSNHCRLTLSAANKEGLKCRLILEERVAGTYNKHASGNNFLYHLLGVESSRLVPGGTDMSAELEKEAAAVRAEGRKAYIIPGGASNAVGALGYVACAQELAWQMLDMGLAFDHVVVPSGSAGTHAGMVVGFHAQNIKTPITGINVSRTQEVQEPFVHRLVEKVVEKIGLDITVPQSKVRALGDWVGAGYSIPTDEMVEAVNLLARTESILLDPVYSGKAMAGFIGLIRRGEFTKGQKVLFLHTGGSPALYAYTDTFFNK